MAVSTTQRDVLFGSCQYNYVLVPYTQCIVSIPDGCPGAREGGGVGATEGDTLRTVHYRGYNQVV